jgi:hypothetical protein
MVVACVFMKWVIINCPSSAGKEDIKEVWIIYKEDSIEKALSLALGATGQKYTRAVTCAMLVLAP